MWTVSRLLQHVKVVLDLPSVETSSTGRDCSAPLLHPGVTWGNSSREDNGYQQSELVYLKRMFNNGSLAMEISSFLHLSSSAIKVANRSTVISQTRD